MDFQIHNLRILKSIRRTLMGLILIGTYSSTLLANDLKVLEKLNSSKNPPVTSQTSCDSEIEALPKPKEDPFCESFFEYACARQKDFDPPHQIDSQIIEPILDELEKELQKNPEVKFSAESVRRLQLAEEKLKEPRFLGKESVIPQVSKEQKISSPYRSLAKILLLREGAFSTSDLKFYRTLQMFDAVLSKAMQEINGSGFGSSTLAVDDPLWKSDFPYEWDTEGKIKKEWEKFLKDPELGLMAAKKRDQIFSRIDKLSVIEAKSSLVNFSKKALTQFVKQYSAHPEVWAPIFEKQRHLKTVLGMASDNEVNYRNKLTLDLAARNKHHDEITVSLGYQLLPSSHDLTYVEMLTHEIGHSLDYFFGESEDPETLKKNRDLFEHELEPILSCLRKENSIKAENFLAHITDREGKAKTPTEDKNQIAKNKKILEQIDWIKKYPLPQFDQIEEALPDLIGAYAAKKYFESVGSGWSIERKREFLINGVRDSCDFFKYDVGDAVRGSPHSSSRDRVEKILFPAVRDLMGCPPKPSILDCLKN